VAAGFGTRRPETTKFAQSNSGPLKSRLKGERNRASAARPSDTELLEDRLVQQRPSPLVGAAVRRGAVRSEADGDIEDSSIHDPVGPGGAVGLR